MTTLLIATRNLHKVQEIRAILGEQFSYLTLKDFPNAPATVEDAGTFAGNATKKAVELANYVAAGNMPAPLTPALSPKGAREPAATVLQKSTLVANNKAYVLADDSGLEVDVLNGAPGVYSARFAATDSGDGNSPDADNNAKLLRLLKDVPREKRTARFRCVIALTPVIRPAVEASSPVCSLNEAELQTEIFDGACEGRIDFAPRGRGGFGYDPLFIPDGFTESFAELGEATKNQLSHRAKALAKLKHQFSAAQNPQR